MHSLAIKKNILYWYMQQHRTQKHAKKEDRHKKPHIIWFCLYEISREAKL